MQNAGIFDKVFQGLFPASKYMLVKNIAADIEHRRKDPALVCAARDGAVDLFKLLLNHLHTIPQHTTTNIRGGVGVVDCQSIRGAALYVACCSRNPRMVELLIQSKLPLLDLESKDSSGRTPLYAAATVGDAEIVKMLVEAHANLLSYSEEGRLPLHEAAIQGHSAVVKVLVDAGAEPSSRSRNPLEAFQHPLKSADRQNGPPNHFLGQTDGITALEIAHNVKNAECGRILQKAMQAEQADGLMKTLSGTLWSKPASQDILKNWPAQPSKPSPTQKGQRVSTICLTELPYNPTDSIVEGSIEHMSFEQMRDRVLDVPAMGWFNPANNLPGKAGNNRADISCLTAPSELGPR